MLFGTFPLTLGPPLGFFFFWSITLFILYQFMRRSFKSQYLPKLLVRAPNLAWRPPSVYSTHNNVIFASQADRTKPNSILKSIPRVGQSDTGESSTSRIRSTCQVHIAVNIFLPRILTIVAPGRRPGLPPIGRIGVIRGSVRWIRLSRVVTVVTPVRRCGRPPIERIGGIRVWVGWRRLLLRGVDRRRGLALHGDDVRLRKMLSHLQYKPYGIHVPDHRQSLVLVVHSK